MQSGILYGLAKIGFNTDNSTDVAVWYTQFSEASDFVDPARKIFLLSVHNNFLVKFEHIASIDNFIVDALSRL